MSHIPAPPAVEYRCDGCMLYMPGSYGGIPCGWKTVDLDIYNTDDTTQPRIGYVNLELCPNCAPRFGRIGERGPMRAMAILCQPDKT